MNNNKKVLVTGATGFLGKWLVKSLLQKQYQVFVIARDVEKAKKQFSEMDSIGSVTVFSADVTDLNSLENAFKNMDWVFHLAGVIAYRKKDRQQMETVNVQGTENVIKACLKNQVSRLIYMSSVVAIGASFDDKSILNEQSEYKIQNLNLGYFETKRKAEELVHQSVKENNLDAVILNPSTIYGAGDAEKGSRSVQIKVAKGKFPFYTSGGVNVVAVEDVVEGIISAALVGRKGERYILSGDNITIKQLFEIIAKYANVPAPKYKLPNTILHFVGAIGDILDRLGLKGPISQENAWTSTMFHWFDNRKAKKELNFNPRPSEVAIKNSVVWMKENRII